MRRHIHMNSRWTLLFVLMGAVIAITCCAKKQPLMTHPSEAQQKNVSPENVSPENKITEEGIAAQRLKEETERLKKAALQKFINEDVYFDFDDATLLPDAREVLKKKAEWLNDNPRVSVTIEGHCDERGTVAYNLALGELRAQNIKAFLVDYGISADRMHTISYGSERPVDPGHDETAWAKNRRGHFRMD